MKSRKKTSKYISHQYKRDEDKDDVKYSLDCLLNDYMIEIDSMTDNDAIHSLFKHLLEESNDFKESEPLKVCFITNIIQACIKFGEDINNERKYYQHENGFYPLDLGHRLLMEMYQIIPCFLPCDSINFYIDDSYKSKKTIAFHWGILYAYLKDYMVNITFTDLIHHLYKNEDAEIICIIAKISN